MRHLFARGREDVLTQLAHSRCLLALDFDGTLAPIVAERDAAGMRAETRLLLARVAEHYPVAVIPRAAASATSARASRAPG